MKRLRWVVVLALAIAASGACIAEIREPWMVLVVNGNEYDGILVGYCWSGLTAGLCADGAMREPPVHVIRSNTAVAVQVRTRSGLTELNVRVGPRWESGELQKVDPSRAGLLRLPAGTHYIAISALWSRGDGLFLFGVRVEPPS